jgi:hypothetical protein
MGKNVLPALIMQQVVTRTPCPLEAQGTCLIHLCVNSCNFSGTVEVLVLYKLKILVQSASAGHFPRSYSKLVKKVETL